MILGSFRVPIPWSEVLRRTVREIGEDNCLGLAAQLAFYFLLALFPALLFLFALLGYVPVEDALTEMLAAVGTLAPREFVELLRAQLTSVTEGSHASLLTLGIIGAIWSSSAAMVAIIDALNRAYDVTESRPWWKRRFVAIVLTVALALFTIVAFAFVLVGPSLASWVAAWLRLGPSVGLVWAVARWPVMLFCVVLGVDLVYYFALNRAGRWVWITPGSLLATALWIGSSFAFGPSRSGSRPRLARTTTSTYSPPTSPNRSAVTSRRRRASPRRLPTRYPVPGRRPFRHQMDRLADGGQRNTCLEPRRDVTALSANSASAGLFYANLQCRCDWMSLIAFMVLTLELIGSPRRAGRTKGAAGP